MKIEIENLTKSQEIAIEEMLATWMQLSNLGASRWVSFFVDGDGNFRPKIIINGHKPEMIASTLIGESSKFDDRNGSWKWKGEECKIDFDIITSSLKVD